MSARSTSGPVSQEPRPDGPGAGGTTPSPPPALLPTVILLGRPSHIATVISNCLAGWWLAGGGNTNSISFVLVGTLLVFLGGAFLNDAFDVTFDRQHHRTKPVPARKIGLRSVWRVGLFLLLAGTLVLQWPGRTTAVLALALVLCVILRNALHRLIPFSPVLLGLCRFLLYLLGASVAVRGINGWSIWSGLAIACYAIGLEMASSSREDGRPCWSAAALVLAPAGLAAIMNSGIYAPSALIFGGVFLLWTIWSLRGVLRTAVPGAHPHAWLLLPGMVLADMLAACVARVPPWLAPVEIRELTLIFLGLFAASVLAAHTAKWIERRTAPNQLRPAIS